VLNLKIAFTCSFLAIVVAYPSTAKSEEVKEIDLRSEAGKNAEDAFYVVFLAKEAVISEGHFVGHAFVALGKDDSTAQLCSSRAYGVYPKKGIGWFGPVPAKMVNDTWKNSDFRLIARVDQATFEDLDAYREKYIEEHAEGEYELGSKDCVTFTAESAKRLGLNIPERKDAMLPSTFLQELLKKN